MSAAFEMEPQPRRKPNDRELIETVYAERGKQSASQVAAIVGMTRNAVIGIWNRERARRGDPPMFDVSQEYRDERHRAKLERRRERRRKARGYVAPRVKQPPRVCVPQVRFSEAPPVPANDGAGVPFIELTRQNCHYPLGGLHEPAVAFCGDASIEGYPYCSAHCRIAYVPGSRR